MFNYTNFYWISCFVLGVVSAYIGWETFAICFVTFAVNGIFTLDEVNKSFSKGYVLGKKHGGEYE